jgi:tetratricopeptide (TPR) repeat protein
MKELAKDPANRYQTCAQMASELERLKRDLEPETRHWVDDARKRLAALAPLAQQRRVLAETLDIFPAPPDLEPAVQELVGRLAALSEPYRRRIVSALLADIKDVHEPVGETIRKWQRARAALEEGTRAANAGRTQEALIHFESAIRVEPACRRAAAEADRCRKLTADQRAIDDRADALLAEVRAAAAAGHWQAVVALCSAPAVLTTRTSHEVQALKRRAADALDVEVRDRRLERERALAEADALRRKGHFEDAAREIARARDLDPSASDVRTASERLHVSRLQYQRQTEVGRKTAAAADAARREAGARRSAAAAQRAAETATLLAAAEEALADGGVDRALDLATRALGIDPSNVPARKIAGLARAQARIAGEARARELEAARLLDDARQQLARGQFQKARILASAAAGMDPSNIQPALVLVRIEEDAARAAAEAEQLRQVRQRAQAVAPILELAHAAEAHRDYVRAAWTAENALALDLDCVEAMEILRRATAELDAHPFLKEETVPAAPGDPDATVRLSVPAGVWGRVTEALRSWTRGMKT